MRLQTKGVPNPTDGHAAQSGGLSQTTRAPMSRSPRGGLQRLDDDLLDLSVSDPTRCSRARLVIEARQAVLQKSRTPLDHHAWRDAEFARHLLIIEALGGSENHPRAPRQQRLTARPMGQRLKLFLFFWRQEQRLSGPSGAHLIYLPYFRRAARQVSSVISGTGH